MAPNGRDKTTITKKVAPEMTGVILCDQDESREFPLDCSLGLAPGLLGHEYLDHAIFGLFHSVPLQAWAV